MPQSSVKIGIGCGSRGSRLADAGTSQLGGYNSSICGISSPRKSLSPHNLSPLPNKGNCSSTLTTRCAHRHSDAEGSGTPFLNVHPTTVF
jgi:hypothetical protein